MQVPPLTAAVGTLSSYGKLRGPLPHRSGGDTDDGIPGGDVFEHDGVRADLGTRSDADGTEDFGADSDLYVVFDDRCPAQWRASADYDAWTQEHIAADDGVLVHNDAEATVTEPRTLADARLGRDVR